MAKKKEYKNRKKNQALRRKSKKVRKISHGKIASEWPEQKKEQPALSINPSGEATVTAAPIAQPEPTATSVAPEPAKEQLSTGVSSETRPSQESMPTFDRSESVDDKPAA